MGNPDPPLDDAEAARLKRDVAAKWAAKSGAWARWADTMAEIADRFNQPLLDAAEVDPGHRVLDLASGVGEPALSAARRVAPEGHVTATDLVPPMLSALAVRVADAGIANLETRLADMEALPFADASFDRVTCRFGIMFSPRPERAMGEARRVLRPGGRAAFLVWGPVEDNTLFHVVHGVIGELIASTPFSAHLTPFRYGEPGSLAAVMRAGGFAGVEERSIHFAPRPPAELRFWQQNVEMSLGSTYDTLPAATREAMEAEIARRFAPYRDGDGFQLAAHVRLASGRAPG